MPATYLSRRWRSQPSGLLRPNNEFMQRPVALWDARSGHDLVPTGTPLKVVGSRQQTGVGLAQRQVGSTTGHRWDTGGRLPSSSRYKPTGDSTFAAYFIKRSSNGSTKGMGGCCAWTDGFSIGEGYGLNYSYANAGGIQVGLTSQYTLDKPIVAIVTKRGATIRFYVDGKLHGSSTSGGATTYDATFTSMFWGGNIDLTPGCTMDTFWVMFDNTGWSDAKCLALCAEPWRVFSPERRPVFYSAGGGAYTLTADAGTYSVSAADAGMRAARRLSANAGSYAYSGAAAGLYVGRRLTADAAAYSVTGNDAVLSYSGGVTHYTMTADAGSFAVTGSAASLLVGRKLVAAAGSYSVGGQTAAFARAYRLTADATSYSVSLNAATLTYSGAGSLLWTPQTPGAASWVAQSAGPATWTPQ